MLAVQGVIHWCIYVQYLKAVLVKSLTCAVARCVHLSVNHPYPIHARYTLLPTNPSQVQRDNYCYSWAAGMPNSSFYNDNLTKGNPDALPSGFLLDLENNSLDIPAATSVLPQLDENGNNITVLGCSKPPKHNVSVAGYWASVDLPNANTAVLSYKLVDFMVPFLVYLAGSLDIAPTGLFNPVDGKVCGWN